MPARGAPWWILAAAATFALYFGLLLYCTWLGPEEPGITVAFRGRGMLVKSVLANSPADHAGVRPGDVVLALDGKPVANRFDWMAAVANRAVARPLKLTVDRSGRISDLSLTSGRRAWADWVGRGAAVAVLLWIVRLAALVLAIVLALRRPRDVLARLGAWFLASASVSSVAPLNGMAAVWRDLPPFLANWLWLPALSTLLLAPIFFTFFALFPSGFSRRPWLLAVAWIPALVELDWPIRFFYGAIYDPQNTGVSIPKWFLPAFSITGAGYVAGGIAALAWTYRRLEGAPERRRVRWLLVSAALGWAAVLPLILFDWWDSASSFAPLLFTSPLGILAALVFLGCVFSLAYTLLHHRVFGFRVILRQGLQYALARKLLLSLVPALAIALVTDLLMHAEQPLISILQARGWIYFGLAAFAYTAQSQRARWLATLDRRFFRERYDAERLLREVVEEIHGAASLEQAAPRVVARIEAALHPEFVAILAREPGDSTFQTLAASPAGNAPPPLPANSRLVALVQVLGTPLELPVSSSGWLDRQLPREEVELVHNARIDLLVPVALRSTGQDVLLVLGFKRSEEPYTADDRNLLVAIATSMALLVEKSTTAPAQRTGPAFQECPDCGVCYDEEARSCAEDRSALILRPLPRLLAARYRLERRLGQGGMGAVYEATDLALERRVAVKLIHDQFLGSREAADRFRREARAAAGLSHPNIVTVHDFGVAEGIRAFIVMELLEGISLREELRRGGRLPVERVHTILGGICAGIEAAHRRQLVHRDLKPENIFLARSEAGEIPKVLDFGLAKSLSVTRSISPDTETMVQTEAGILVGTLQYMAPEQLRGEAPHASWDLWALAVVVYEMLAGVRPFRESSRAELHRAVLAASFTAIEEHLPQVSAEVQAFFRRALSVEPGARPRDARDFLEQFELAVGRA